MIKCEFYEEPYTVYNELMKWYKVSNSITEEEQQYNRTLNRNAAVFLKSMGIPCTREDEE